ncbi:MAG: hypothetical protein ACPGVO_16235 [Spirulinaceae cyanobacterium]
MPPRKCNGEQYQNLLQTCYSENPEGHQTIPLQAAQAIVFGAVEYAKGLGFEPHADFEQGKAHLGEWDGTPQLSFGGKDGQPHFFSGPYDDSQAIIATLEKNVGSGNFHYTALVGGNDLENLLL